MLEALFVVVILQSLMLILRTGFLFYARVHYSLSPFDGLENFRSEIHIRRHYQLPGFRCNNRWIFDIGSRSHSCCKLRQENRQSKMSHWDYDIFRCVDERSFEEEENALYRHSNLILKIVLSFYLIVK